ncbi:heavy metal translocating P-type ATPase [Spiribacter halobius]|uniref:heavy metal translocating P-type ATPase n=1 Tax=Sediminicurvatus halobius TaxID=2182432 RepID=UPI001304CC27|nr:heavy metal translocating P-type ATPase [Spiribacter halobius]UEX78586.1 heavy metal translocating P-type ATPase [Spiribacter halobius]
MSGCYHCGEPLPAGKPRTVVVSGEAQPVCCAGCAAVASLIAGAGLQDFYRFRSAPAPRPEQAGGEDWSAWDADAAQSGSVRTRADGAREVVLLLEGLRCAACGWLIEHLLGRAPGVREVSVNPATARALVVWNPARTGLGALLARLDGLGYRPHPLTPGEHTPAALRERRAALRRLAVAGLGMMQVMMYAVGLYAGGIHQGMDPAIETLLRWVSALVATPVALYAGWPFFRGAWRDLRARRPGMDVPVALAVGGAYLASLWHTVQGQGEVYFDSVTMFVFFLTLARFLELGARQRAGRASTALGRLLPATALRLDGNGEARVPLAALRVGDRLRVRPGEAVPADGCVLAGHSHLDESLLTGEPLPRHRGPGDVVVGGSTNTAGALEIRVTRLGADSVLSSVMRLLERAQAERPRVARLADHTARYFVLAVLLAAGATALAWWQIDPGRAFEVTLAVLVITCPCALSLATPSALVAATSGLARHGLLVARADALERLAGIRQVVLDKTGTLTRGRITLTATTPLGALPEAECRALAASLEAEAGHPLARAFDGEARADGIEAIESIPGAGVEGRWQGQRLRLGRPDWVAALARTSHRFAKRGRGDGGQDKARESPGAQAYLRVRRAPGPSATPDCPPDPRPQPRIGEMCGLAGITAPAGQDDGATVVMLGTEAGLLARFRLQDEPRPEAAAAVEALREAGLAVSIASGDARGPVSAVARSLGIDDWHAGLDPAGKLAVLARKRDDGAVAMVGDGVNDAPVLAGADVSVAMGSGAALAHGSADLLLVGERLAGLAEAVRLARRTRGVIRQNLAWAAGYNALALPLAALGQVPPWAAAIGMSASSVLVVLNATRLARRAPDRETPAAPALQEATS